MPGPEREQREATARHTAALRARLSGAGFATGLGDEGGFAPDIAHPEDVLTNLVTAITDAGYTAGRTGSPSRWTPPPASSTATAATTSPASASAATTWSPGTPSW